MNILLNLFLIQVLVCFVIDLSGFLQEMETFLAKILHYRVAIPKPFSCSLCMGWWINLLYLLFSGGMTLGYVSAVAMIAFASKHITGLIRWCSELLVKLETILYKIIR